MNSYTVEYRFTYRPKLNGTTGTIIVQATDEDNAYFIALEQLRAMFPGKKVYPGCGKLVA